MALIDRGVAQFAGGAGELLGPPPNGRPSVVSLEAHTTDVRRRAAAAWKTLKFIVTLSLNVTAGVARPGAGMFARCTTASAPRSTSVACP